MQQNLAAWMAGGSLRTKIASRRGWPKCTRMHGMLEIGRMDAMIRVKSLFWSIVAIVLISAGSRQQSFALLAQYSGPGVINGTVTYEGGSPVKGATITAHPKGRPIAAQLPWAESDPTGHFEIKIPRDWFGEFSVTAKKVDEDYPDMNWPLYNDGKLQTVTLTASQPTATLTIRLGPKTAVLFGTVADALTDAPLNPCAALGRAGDPRSRLSGTGLVNAKYRLLVPSNADVLIKIWLDGYKSWYYPGTTDESQGRPVRLKPGEETELNIRLTPDGNAQPEECGMPVGTVVKP
jgi:hypothetical protein